jgi:TfoX/Sxy family transcriptional regulator of competence genes
MAYDEAMAKRLRAVFASRSDVEERKMFGGLCFLVGGHMCCGLTSEAFMVRVGKEQFDEAIAQPHARPMDFTGRPSTGMVYVDPQGLGTRPALAKWVKRGLDFVETLPSKKKAKRPARQTARRG